MWSMSCGVIFLVLLRYQASGRSYDGYVLIRAVPTTPQQLHYVQSLSSNLEFEGAPIDFWRVSRGLNQSSDIVLSPLVRAPILLQMSSLGLEPQVLMANIGDVIEYQSLNHLRGRADGADGVDYFADYHPVVEMYEYLESLRAMNPDYSEIETIGQSAEGRDLKLLKIGNSADKSIIWIDGGTHAREWIGPTTALFMATQLSQAKQSCSSGGDCPDDMRRLLDGHDFYIISSVNPDGYEFSRSDDRLWRKTRSESTVIPWNLFCRGTDPNRNYDAKWGKEGSSGNPCAQTYAGPQPHSEKEIKALTAKVMTIRDRVKLFITLHSYSQIMLLPYGHSTDIPPEYDDLEKLAILGADAIKAVNGTEYKIGASARILYAASGTASDWAFESARIKYSYTFELPDTGDQGFLLPPERIRPVGVETWAGIKTMALNLL